MDSKLYFNGGSDHNKYSFSASVGTYINFRLERGVNTDFTFKVKGPGLDEEGKVSQQDGHAQKLDDIYVQDEGKYTLIVRSRNGYVGNDYRLIVENHKGGKETLKLMYTMNVISYTVNPLSL
ncbi:hypothetical protein [Brevibacillus laterosporus]|uniref:hypothetical protein n=1 Tax=Brevibacillus laterosporus TaxID=1465 RepID=UPI0003B22069|nr:hypothetical protein [Brevibacillus laterosporus]ERM16067.1 hypothetical protein P615_05120 [Brevibacillus laterosporus PE36]